MGMSEEERERQIQLMLANGMADTYEEAAALVDAGGEEDEERSTPADVYAAKVYERALDRGYSYAAAGRKAAAARKMLLKLGRVAAESFLADVDDALQGGDNVLDAFIADEDQQYRATGALKDKKRFREDWQGFLLDLKLSASLEMDPIKRERLLTAADALDDPATKNGYLTDLDQAYDRASEQGADQTALGSIASNFFTVAEQDILDILPDDLQGALGAGIMQTATRLEARANKEAEFDDVAEFYAKMAGDVIFSPDTPQEVRAQLSQSWYSFQRTLPNLRQQYGTGAFATPEDILGPMANATLNRGIAGTEWAGSLGATPLDTLANLKRAPGEAKTAASKAEARAQDLKTFTNSAKLDLQDAPPEIAKIFSNDMVLQGIFEQSEAEGVPVADMYNAHLKPVLDKFKQQQQQATTQAQLQAGGALPFGVDASGKPIAGLPQETPEQLEKRRNPVPLPSGLNQGQNEALAALGFDPNNPGIIPGGTATAGLPSFFANTPAFKALAPEDQAIAAQEYGKLYNQFGTNPETRDRLDLNVGFMAQAVAAARTKQQERQQAQATRQTAAQSLFLPTVLQGQSEALRNTYANVGRDAYLTAAKAALGPAAGQSAYDSLEANLAEAERNAQQPDPLLTEKPTAPKVKTTELKPARPSRRV